MPDNNDDLNLDLISMVQRARMAHDADAKPSDVSAVYWIEAKAPPTAPQPTPRAGMWIIPTTVQAVDALWAKIKTATEAGELGYKSKVSTSPAKKQGRADDRVIHVLTADSTDAADVQRVRDALRTLGLTQEIRYEAR